MIRIGTMIIGVWDMMIRSMGYDRDRKGWEAKEKKFSY